MAEASREEEAALAEDTESSELSAASAGVETSESATEAPREYSVLAVARPMPEAAPVIAITLPARDAMFVGVLLFSGILIERITKRMTRQIMKEG